MSWRGLTLSAALFAAGPASADDIGLHRVMVEGARDNQLGVADAASAGSVSQQQLAARTVYRPGELLEAVPGLIASQHSGEGKANQFYLRGFNIDHGTDLKTTVDDMPVNQRSHAHGQGWTDLNFMIPELAARLDYKKGPYSAADGDFASAGSASVVYASRLTRGLTSATVGQDGYRRALLANSQEVNASPGANGGSLLYALEAMHNDGPFTRGDDFRKVNGVLRYSQGYANNGFNLTAMAYSADWNATDQIPQRAIGQGLLGRFDGVDPTDGGKAHRYSLSGAWRRSTEASASRVSAYVIASQLDLYSNFTYFLDDPVNGDQFAQPDRRVTSGLDASHSWHSHAGDSNITNTVGLQLQNDNIFNGLYNTAARQRLSTTREDHIVESSLGLYAENRTRWNPQLRTTLGLRADAYRFDVAGDRRENSGVARDRQLSPSVGAVYSPWQQAELYFNAGSGFHSNDARGATISVDPKSGAAADPVSPLVRSRGLELGLRSTWLPGLQSALSIYRLDFDSELVFIGDAGATEAGPPSRRHGVELSNYYRPVKWLGMDADLAFARARTRGGQGGQRIAGAVEGVAQLALTVDRVGPQSAWSGALRLRWFGPRPLTEDNSVRSRASTTLNGRIAYRLSRDVRVELEGFNLASKRAAAIEYYYASRLKDEAAAVEDIHFHPVEPRSVRLMLVRTF